MLDCQCWNIILLKRYSCGEAPKVGSLTALQFWQHSLGFKDGLQGVHAMQVELLMRSSLRSAFTSQHEVLRGRHAEVHFSTSSV